MSEDILEMDEELLDIDNADDLFVKPQKKWKILLISDHILAPSGVGIESKLLASGLVDTGKFTFRCLGGAIKHADYRTIAINDDLIVKPVDGFGTPDMIRSLLYTEKPDAVMLVTDPRQFIWLFNMEDEIKQVCPIVYWTIWDNDPYPSFNKPWYDSCELLNCISYKTYSLLKPHYPDRTHYIPHAFPKEMYFPLPKQQVEQLKQQNFGNRANWFKALWVNRNATRKLPADVLESWKGFLDQMEEKEGHREAMLIMHTDPNDQEGPNLLAVAEMLGLQDNVWFSTEKLEFKDMNILHNLVDCVVNVSKNEGYGLSTHISMQVGVPVIALKTGGETDKVVDYRDGSEHGVALEPVKRSLVGSQMVPFIYEDFYGRQDLIDAFFKLKNMPADEKEKLSQKCIQYVDDNLSYDNMVQKWDETLTQTIENWKAGKFKQWELLDVNPPVQQQQHLQQPQEQVQPQQQAPDLEAGTDELVAKKVAPEKPSKPQFKAKPKGKKNKKAKNKGAKK